MTGYQPFLIGQFTTGVDKDMPAWMLPQEAFQEMVNGYIKHTTINKRGGYEIFGRLPNGRPDNSISGITNADPGSITVADNTGIANGQLAVMRNLVGGTFDTLDGVTLVITNLVGSTFDLYDTDGNTVNTTALGSFTSGVLWTYPKLPVMGLQTFIDATGARQHLAFDTRRASIYNNSLEAYEPIGSADVFTGDNSNFISTGYFGRTAAFATPTFFISNFNGDTSGAVDPIQAYTTGATALTDFIPNANTGGSAVNINAAQFIFTLRQRLILLNTVEDSGSGDVQFPQRMRWSRALNPDASGEAWDQTIPGNGGFNDAATQDRIIGAQNLQDQIIVFFSTSTWRIVPTGDPALPFKWDKINDFRACDGSYSTIPHDRYAVSFGQRGIVACDGVEVQRIDNKIQDYVVEEFNLDYFKQVYSARDYQERRSWTLYPSALSIISSAEPESSNRALVRTEEEGAWSTYTTTVIDDNGALQNFSTVGYGAQFQDLTLADFNGVIAPDYMLDEFGDETLGSFYTQANAELFLGGDQIGRVFLLEKGATDNGQPIGFSLTSAGWNPFKDQGVNCQFGYIDLYVDTDPNVVVDLSFYVDDIDAPYASQSINLLPNLGFIADIQGITQANPALVTADEHGLTTGDQVYIYSVQGMTSINGLQYTVTVVDDNSFTLDGIDSTAFNAYTSGGVIVERPFFSTRVWKRAYAGGTGYLHYLKLTENSSQGGLKILGMVPWMKPAGTRMIG